MCRAGREPVLSDPWGSLNLVEETSALQEIEAAKRQGDYLVELEVERSGRAGFSGS